LLQPFLSNIRKDDQELNRQVFSLLVFKRLSPTGEFALGNASGDALTTFSEFVSNQLSNWISQVDSNLEVDIGVSSGNIDPRTGLRRNSAELNTRIGYSFLEGRLRVSRESSLSNTNTTGASSTAAAVGDWRAEYYLRPDGKLRLKLEYVTSGINYGSNYYATASASIVHTEQFDSFGELFRRRKLSRRLQREQEKLDQRKKYEIEPDEPTDLMPPAI
jgi:hypothetical protein